MLCLHDRSEAQQRLFDIFKASISAYKKEIFHQREILKKLYHQVVKKIDCSEKFQKTLSVEYLNLLQRIKDMYISSLNTTLLYYKNAKVAYISSNKRIFEYRQSHIERVHEKCRVMLRDAAKELHGSFVKNVVKVQLRKVSDSIEIGQNKFLKVRLTVLDEERQFLHKTSEDFSRTATEVRNGLNEFEYVVKSTIFEWNDMEEKINRIVRKDQATLLYSIKTCLHDFTLEHNRGLQPFFERHREIEEIVVSYMMERYYSFVKVANGEEDSVISSKAPESITSKSTENTSKRRKRRLSNKTSFTVNDEEVSMCSGSARGSNCYVDTEIKKVTESAEKSSMPISNDENSNSNGNFSEVTADEKHSNFNDVDSCSGQINVNGVVNSSNNSEEHFEGDVSSGGESEGESCEDSGDEDLRDEDGKLILPPNKCGLDYLLRLNKSIENFTEKAKRNIMRKIRKRFMTEILAKEKERKLKSFDKAHDLVENVESQWRDLHRDLMLLISSHIVEARGRRSDMTMKLWDIVSNFRNWEFTRLQNLNESSVYDFKKLRKPEMTKSDNKDLKLFEQYERKSQNVIVSAAVELAPGHKDTIPPALNTFLRHINSCPSQLMKEFSTDLKEFYTLSHSDDMHYNIMTTLEHLSSSLNDVRHQVRSIVDDYEKDKSDTLNMLKYNSQLRRNIQPNIQVGSVLDTMVETVVARNSMSKHLAEQITVTDRRSKQIEKDVNAFLSDNSFSDNFLSDGTMTPKFIEETALGQNNIDECKLKSTATSKHGICERCTAELFYTVHRNNVIYTSKIGSIKEKLKGMVAQEAINGRTMRKRLHTLLKRACIEMEQIEFGMRNEIIDCLEESFKKRLEAGETNSIVNEPAESIADRFSGPFVRDTDAIMHELVAAVKKPPRKEGVVIDYTEFSDCSEMSEDASISTFASNDLRSEGGERHDGSNDLRDRSQLSVEDTYFNGIFQRSHTSWDGTPVLHGDKLIEMPVNPMEFSASVAMKEEEKEIDDFLRKHEEFTIMEKDLEEIAMEEERNAIAEAQLVASYDESQEELERQRLAELERIQEEEERKAAEREAIRIEAYEQAEMEFFQKYPERDPNIYSYSNKFDKVSLQYKKTRTMVNPKTYEEASDDYKDQALAKLLQIGGDPNKKHPFDTYVPPPEVPKLHLAAILERYQDLVSLVHITALHVLLLMPDNCACMTACTVTIWLGRKRSQ